MHHRSRKLYTERSWRECKKSRRCYIIGRASKSSGCLSIANGLNEADSTVRWLEAKGVSLDMLEEFIETNLLIDKVKGKRVAGGRQKAIIIIIDIQKIR